MAEQKVNYVQALTTVFDIGEGKLYRCGVPLGGIGAGKIDLTPDACVTNVTTNNNIEAPICDGHAATPAKIVKGGVPNIFWAIWNDKDGARILKCDAPEGTKGVDISNISFDAKLPVAEYKYRGIGDIDVDLTAFSSLVIGDTSEAYKDSSLPAAVFSFILKNNSAEKRSYRLLFSWQNMIGTTGYYNARGWGITDNRGNEARFRDDGDYHGAYFYTTRERGKDKRAIGNFSLCVDAPENTKTEFRTWKDAGHLWMQYATNSPLHVGDREPWHQGADAIIAVSGELEAGEQINIPYCVSWYFPHLVEERNPDKDYGHNYCNFFSDSWQVNQYVLSQRDRLFAETKKWQNMIWDSSLPEWFKYKMCDDLFPMYTSSWYTKKGEFSISEAVTNMGAMMGTIDQRNSSQAPYLMFFGGLGRSELDLFREKQVLPGADNEYGRHWNFANGTAPEDYLINQVGAIPHDIGHDDLSSYAIVPNIIWVAGHWPDLISGYILQQYAYMCWNGEGDIGDELYESMKLAEGFLRRIDFDGDCVPELWGAGSSTYDNFGFPYYGVTPFIATMYMASLAALERVARRKGDAAYADELLQRRKTSAETLIRENWTGEYFKCWTHKAHHDWDNGPRAHGESSDTIHISQLAGQWYASMMGLGYLLPKDKMESALKVITENNHAKVNGAAPIEFAPAKDGKPESYGESWPHYATTYYVALSIYENCKDEGMEQFYKFWRVLLKNNARWDCGLGIAGENNETVGGRWYMTNTAGWFCMLALAGVWIDIPEKELMIAPNLPPQMGNKLEAIPVFGNTFKARVDHEKTASGFTSCFTVTECTSPLCFESIKLRFEAGKAPRNVAVYVKGEKAKESAVYDVENGYATVKAPFAIAKDGDNVKIKVEY